MEKLKYELSEEEVDFIIKALNEVPVKGLASMNYMMQVVNKLQNPLNKDEEKERQRAELDRLKKGIPQKPK